MNIKFNTLQEKFNVEPTTKVMYFKQEPDSVLDFFIEVVTHIEFKDYFTLYKKLNDLGYNGFEVVKGITTEQLTEVLKKLNRQSRVTINRALIMLKGYAKFCGMDVEYGVIDNFNVDDYIDKIGVRALYISKNMLDNEINEISKSDETNIFYYTTMARAIFYGIFSNDYTVIKNLRASDITNNIHGENSVVLRNDDGDEWKIDIPYDLARDMIELSEIETWEKRNSHGSISIIDMDCAIPDKVFKSVLYGRNKASCGNTEGFYNVYRVKMRYLFRDCFGRNITPLNIFYSGMFYQINEALKEQGTDLSILLNKTQWDLTQKENEIIHRIMCDVYRVYKPLYWLRDKLMGHLSEIME